MKKYFSVKCTNKNEAEKVLKLFEKEGCLWNDGSKPLEYLSWFNKYSPTYLNHEDKRLTFSNFGGFYDDVIDANDYIKKKTKKSKPLEKNVIVITKVNNKEVVAVNLANNEKATAKCHPDDEFDFNTGAKIAFNRLIECEKEKANRVKLKDRVKFKDPNNIYSYELEWFQTNVKFYYWNTAYAYATPSVFTPEEIIDSEVMCIAPHSYDNNRMLALVRVVYKGTDLDVFYLTDLDNLEKVECNE